MFKIQMSYSNIINSVGVKKKKKKKIKLNLKQIKSDLLIC